MKDGFIKCAVCTPTIRVADTEFNAQKIIELINSAQDHGVKLAVFPELSVTGATAGEMLNSDTLLDNALSATLSIAAATAATDTLSILGLPVKYGGKVYNCAVALHAGEILGFVPKAYLSAEDSAIFADAKDLGGIYGTLKFGNDMAPFSTSLIFSHSEVQSFRVGVEIGNQLFSASGNAEALAAAGATIIANCAAIADTPKSDSNMTLLSVAASAKLNVGYILSNAGEGESTTDSVFSGHSLIAENGEVLSERLPYSDSALTVTEIDTDALLKCRTDRYFPPRDERFTDVLFFGDVTETTLTRQVNRSPFEAAVNREYFFEKTLTAAAYGLKKRICHTHTKKLVLGISGGLDSTLALLICTRAAALCGLEATDIVAVTMPCFGTSERTRSNAEALCEELGVALKYIDIKAAVSAHLADIGHKSTLDIAYENAQARERTQILMDLANSIGGMVIGTGDLSELALGFATYNGDQMSMYGVNASIPKTLIRALTAHEAKRFGGKIGEILTDILNTPVSPELLPPENGEIAQVTEDIVGPYELHDFFIYNMFAFNCRPRKLYRLAAHAFKDSYDSDTVLKWLKVFLRRFFAQQFKRSCMPDGAQVTDISFSPRSGLHLPSDMVATLWLNETENL